MASVNSVLITGIAGFIGFHAARHLVEAGRDVIGVDNLSPYCDPTLKDARVASHLYLEHISAARLRAAVEGRTNFTRDFLTSELSIV